MCWANFLFDTFFVGVGAASAVVVVGVFDAIDFEPLMQIQYNVYTGTSYYHYYLTDYLTVKAWDWHCELVLGFLFSSSFSERSSFGVPLIFTCLTHWLTHCLIELEYWHKVGRM